MLSLLDPQVPIYPVTPTYEEILGLACYAEVGLAPTSDLVIVAGASERVEADVAVGMRQKALCVRDFQAAQPDMVAVAEGVDVVAGAGADVAERGIRIQAVCPGWADTGLMTDEFKTELENEFGIKPRWSLECFKDPYQDVRQSMSRLQRVPYLMDKAHIRGFVYEMADGLLHEVEPDPRHMNLGPSGIDL